jgi:hypothetical protein
MMSCKTAAALPHHYQAALCRAEFPPHLQVIHTRVPDFQGVAEKGFHVLHSKG